MDPYIGEIRLFGFTWAPQGWAECQGQILPINQNQALFSLLGTTYGGDGQTTYALPTLPGPSDGAIYCIALQGIYPQRP
jgi:microcystin-dependent protein